MNRFSLFLGSALLACACVIVQPPPPEEPRQASPQPAAAASSQVAAPAPVASALAAPSTPEPPSEPVSAAPVFRASPPAPAGFAASFFCDGFEIEQGVVPPRECQLWPTTSPRAVPGIEVLPEPVQACVLTNLPGMTQDTQPGWCQTWAARVLQDRLQQLGWLDAQVAPGENKGSGARPPRVWVTVQLGERYEIGAIDAQLLGPSPWTHLKIIEEAQRAIPAGAAWYTRSTMEAMHDRLVQTKAFMTVAVQGGVPDRERKVVPLSIEVSTDSLKRKQAPYCPEQLIRCPYGESCEINHERRCRICRCTSWFKYGS
jgi:hypothetical protein